MWGNNIGPSVRWAQVSLLSLLTAFVGSMWGLERTTIPLLARDEFGIASTAVTLSFIVGFGLSKTFANLSAGWLMDRFGRRWVLIGGWAVGLPVPLLIIWAPSWEWVVGANLLLGLNQGLCWTATIIMMMDSLGRSRHGLATGLNEFMGYGGVALATLAGGFIAGAYGPRPYVFLVGAGIALAGLAISALLVRETRHLVAGSPTTAREPRAPGFLRAVRDSIRNPSLLGCNQGGLVTKVNDATIWGLLPLLLASQGLGPARIGVVASVYPAVWGVSQFFTGTLSDRVGRKPLIALGMAVQGLGMWSLGMGVGFPAWVVGAVVLGLGTALVYPTLIAAVGDHSHPAVRASSVGVYRWYRDGGFVVGAITAGAIGDLLGLRPAFLLVGALSLASAVAVLGLLRQASPGRHPTGPAQNRL